MRRALFAVVPLLAGACGPKEPPRPPAPPRAVVKAAAATGDFRWSRGDVAHVLRAGAASLRAGWIEIVLADVEVANPCTLLNKTEDDFGGPARVRFSLPRGLHEEWPLGRTISPDTLAMLPLELGTHGVNRVPRYKLTVDALDLKPAGRVSGSLTWITAARVVSGKAAPASSGEGTFDVPICSTSEEIAALGALPKPHDVETASAVKGRTTTGPFVLGRAIAELRRWDDLPPHVVRIELHADPLTTCGSRGAPKRTTVLVEIDSATGLGERLGSKQPVSGVRCLVGSTSWECFGPRHEVRGYVELQKADLRPGGTLVGTLAIEGASGASIAGTFETDLCGGP